MTLSGTLETNNFLYNIDLKDQFYKTFLQSLMLWNNKLERLSTTIKWSSLQKVLVNILQYSFIRSTPEVDLIKLFLSKFPHTFCKLDHFININNINDIAMKSPSLHKKSK